MQDHHTATAGAFTCAQFARFLQILEPYRNDRITATVIESAATLARQEVAA